MPLYQTPYSDNVGGGWGPPQGVAYMLAKDREQVEQGFKALGAVGGAVGAGAIGGVQGAMSPETFGAGTSPGSGAMQGFAMNYKNAGGPGSGGGQGGGFSSLIGGGEGGGSGGGGNFKQLQAKGKVADQFRELMKSSTPTMEGEDPKILGVTDDHWKTMGANEKFGTVANIFQAQQMQASQMAYKKGMADFARAADEQRARAAFKTFVQQNPNATPQDTLRAGLAAGVNADDLARFAQAQKYIASETPENNFFKPGDTNFALPSVPGYLRVPTGPNTSQILTDPNVSGKAVAITGPGGEALGFGLPNRGGVQPLPATGVRDKDKYERLSKQLDSLIGSQGKAITEAGRTAYQKQIDSVEAQIKELESATTEPPKAVKGGKYKLVDGELKLVQ